MANTLNNISLERWHDQIRDHLYRIILPFWMHESLDSIGGGFWGEISCDHEIHPEAPKGLILNARLLWTFSTLYRRDPWGEYRNLAQRAFIELVDKFWDPIHSGFGWMVDRTGVCVDDRKKIYGQAFAIYGLVEFAHVFERPEAYHKARQVYDLIERHAWDEQYGGYIEVCQADWSVASDCRLSDKDMDEKKSMNNHLHLLEAYTQFYRCFPNDQLKCRLMQLLDLFDRYIITSDRCHLGHFFDESWHPRSDNYTYGHDIEASWLLVETAEVLGDEAICHRVKDFALPLARTVLAEGLDPQGGLYYEGRAGQPTDRNKEWWPQAEAVVGFLNAYQLAGDSSFLHAAFKLWDFIETRMVDRERGEWFWRVDPQGQPDRTQPKLSAWKTPYHNARACLETMERLMRLEEVLA